MPQDKRFLPSGLNSRFQQQSLSFKAYIDSMRNMIAAARTDLNQANHHHVINANTPFDYPSLNPQSKKGVLLIHGLYDSPCTMKTIGKHLQKKGFWVRSILLPGHGTVPGDLLDVTMEDWIEASKFGVDSFRDQVNELYIVGFSTGGSLAIHLAQQQLPIKGLVLVAPAIKIKNPFARLTQWHDRWQWLGSRSQWLLKTADKDYSRYESITLNSINQVYQLTHLINQGQKDLKLPIMMISTEDDEVISHKACMRFMAQQSDPDCHSLVYGSNADSNDKITRRCSYFPEQHIINFSHQAMLIPPQDPHYGQHGDYIDLRHYQTPLRHFLRSHQEDLYRGAPSIKKMRHYYMARLTYNPDFAFMCEKLDEFIK